MSHHYGIIMSTQTASPYISQLFIYPIKSCAGISVSILKFDHRGPRLDRNWMLVDASTGVFLSQREVPRMALISTTVECGRVWAGFGNDKKLMELPTEGRLIDVSIWEDEVQGLDCGDESARFFSEILDYQCRLIYQGRCERLADTEYVSLGTQVSYDGFPLLAVADSSIQFLDSVCDVDIAAENFRPNIVIANTEVFDERNWQSITTEVVDMTVVKPCQRCVIPALNPKTAEQERSILRVLLEYCRRDKKLYFGQNLTFSAVDSAMAIDVLELHVGDDVVI